MGKMLRIMLTVHPYAVLWLPLLSVLLLFWLIMPDVYEAFRQSGDRTALLRGSRQWIAPIVMIIAGLVLLVVPSGEQRKSAASAIASRATRSGIHCGYPEHESVVPGIVCPSGSYLIHNKTERPEAKK
ncbi:hypothetical protein ACGVWS_14700 [Enterobacteriaceae bacterium LUAb1]